MNIDEIKKDLENVLSEKRYMHSVGVMKMAKELARCYGEDEEKAAFAGLIHDIAKEMTKEEIDEYIKEHDIVLDEIEKRNLGLVHAKIGSSIAKEKYNADIQVQNAILYHTTGNMNMDTFAKIIYVADKIEENRTYEGVEEIRKKAKENLDEVMLDTIVAVLEKASRKKSLIHHNTIDTWNYILMNL